MPRASRAAWLENMWCVEFKAIKSRALRGFLSSFKD
jgi:hypothetical protein